MLDADLLAAANKQLETAAEEVFEKYGEAPIQADGALAERLLKTNNLAQIASRDNPLGLVKTVGGKTSIDTKHAAAVSLHDYLDRTGTVDGRKLLDDFFGAPYGWSKDTTRYIVAALLIGGEIKLRVAGADVTGEWRGRHRGAEEQQQLQQSRRFAPRQPAIARGADARFDRLLELTGDAVVPCRGRHR